MTAIFGTTTEVLVYISCTISLLASLSVILCYQLFPHVRTFVTRIIFYLAIAELLSAGSRYVQDCTGFAALQQFTGLSTFCWMATLAIVQYLTVVKHYRLLYKYEIIFHIFNWGLPFIDSLIIGLNNDYGPAGIWCWINNDATIARWIGYFLWLFLTIGILFYCFGSIVFILENRLHSALMPSVSLSHQNTKQFQRELVLYLSVIVFVRIWSVMDRFYDLVSDNEAPDIIKYLHASGSCLQGAINCILLFFNNRTLRQRLMVGINERLRSYQQYRDMKYGTETERLYKIDAYDKESNIQGYANIDQLSSKHGKNESISKSRVTHVSTISADYSQLYPHWQDDYVINVPHKQKASIASLSSNSHQPTFSQKFDPPKSTKLIQSFRVHLATWNSNGSSLYIDNYDGWLPHDSSRDSVSYQQLGLNDKNSLNKKNKYEEPVPKDLPEMVVVSTQELELAENLWEQRIQQEMGYTFYNKILSHHLRNHHMCIFIRRDYKHLIGEINIASTGSAFKQFYGDKGGIAISIDFAGLKLCFVGMDLLEEKQCNIQDKINELKGIIHGLWLGSPEVDFSHQFNALFWLGNMNFCIENANENLNDIIKISEQDNKLDVENEEKKDSENSKHIETDSLVSLDLLNDSHKYYNVDQCYLIRSKEKAFYQCNECNIQFSPTYRLSTSLENIEKYDKSITPRWCSRILYSIPTHPMVNIIPQEYNSSKHLFGSSHHRAVYAKFLINRYNSWFPIPKTIWKFYLQNFQIVLYKDSFSDNFNKTLDDIDESKTIDDDNDKNKHQVENENQSSHPTLFYEPKVNDYNAIYLTIHAPFLDNTLRTPLGKLVQETPEYVVLSFPSRVDFEKQFDDESVRKMGNFCLYIVLRDENLLGDMDGICACSVPLLYDEEVNKHSRQSTKLSLSQVKDDQDDVLVDFAQNDPKSEDVPLNQVPKAVFYRFLAPLTANTAKKGRVEAQIAIRKVAQ